MLSHRTQGKKNIWPEGNSHTLEEKKIKKRNSFRKKKKKKIQELWLVVFLKIFGLGQKTSCTITKGNSGERWGTPPCKPPLCRWKAALTLPSPCKTTCLFRTKWQKKYKKEEICFEAFDKHYTEMTFRLNEIHIYICRLKKENNHNNSLYTWNVDCPLHFLSPWMLGLS